MSAITPQSQDNRRTIAGQSQDNRRAGGLLLAVAQGPAACGTVQFAVGGKQQPALQITDSFIPQVLKLADLNWKVP